MPDTKTGKDEGQDQSNQSSSSSDANNLKFESSPRPPAGKDLCRATIEELREDLLLKINENCPQCSYPLLKHKRRSDIVAETQSELESEEDISDEAPAAKSSTATHHIQKSLPTWRTTHQTCHAFLQTFENILIAGKVPKSEWARLLLFSFTKPIEQNWIKKNIVDEKLNWSQAQTAIKKHFEIYNRKQQLQIDYEKCKQLVPRETVQTYGDRFLDICSELSLSDDNEMAIRHFITGLAVPIQKELNRRIDFANSIGKEFPLTSLLKVVDIAIRIDTSEHGISSLYDTRPINENTTRKPRCNYHPNSTTHSTDECSQNPKNRVSTPVRNPSPSIPNQATDQPKNVPSCSQCGKIGHYRSQCKQLPPPMATRRASAATREIQNISNKEEEYDNYENNGNASDFSIPDDNEENYQLNSMNNNNRVPNLSREEYDKCMKEGRCFKCKAPNHLARNCNKNNNRFIPKNVRSQRQN